MNIASVGLFLFAALHLAHSSRLSSIALGGAAAETEESLLSSCRLSVRSENNGAGFEVFLGNDLWLKPADACIRHQGQDLCVRDGTLAFLEVLHREPKVLDGLGVFTETVFVFKARDVNISTEFILREYEDSSTVILEHHFRDALSETSLPGQQGSVNAGQHGLASRFPSFVVEQNAELPRGVLQLSGIMAGSAYSIEKWDKNLRNHPTLERGPIAIFSERCALVMSSASSFMSSATFYEPGTTSNFSFGVMGSVDKIPKHHHTSMILSSSSLVGKPDGIRRAFKTWGSKLIKQYGTKRPRDPTVEYLQFSTDNGAFYYYQTETGKTYSDTIIHIANASREREIPFRQWLMDSWFYYKGWGNGVKNWTAINDLFPKGIEFVTRMTGWQVVAHNRYWSANTDYARANGGDYEFAIEGEHAQPLTRRFWDDLLRNASVSWGLTTYEQDWLFNQFVALQHNLKSVTNARTWLLQMGGAAFDLGINIQYCMSWPRHILQSLEIPAVTQARVSDDYIPGNQNWRAVGITSMFVDALEIRPSKDSFWSNTTEQVNPRFHSTHEPEGELHAIISSWSKGPVAPSDKYQNLNKPLIMRSCAANGRLLQPDVPAARTDASIMRVVGLSPIRAEETQQDGQVLTTFTAMNGYVWTWVLSASSPGFTISQDDVQPSIATDHYAFSISAQKTEFAPVMLPVRVNQTTPTDFIALGVAPVFSNGWAFMGEATTKWVPVSKDRFSELVVFSDPSVGFSIKVHGDPGEKLHLILADPQGMTRTASCIIARSGVSDFRTNSMRCH